VLNTDRMAVHTINSLWHEMGITLNNMTLNCKPNVWWSMSERKVD